MIFNDSVLAARLSPVKYLDSWLVNVRITGTGAVIRDGHVYIRDKEHYACDDFIKACLGLPVVIGHPKSVFLDAKKYSDSVIGSIVDAYICGDDIMGIARVFADKIPDTNEISTSPTVVFSYSNEAGITFENEPVYIDHIALCYEGVWDKGNDNNKGFNMIAAAPVPTDNEVAAVAAVAPVPVPVDNEALSMIAELKAELAALKVKLDEKIEAKEDEVDESNDDDDALYAIQTKADNALSAINYGVKRPISGEKARNYQLRILNALKSASDSFKDTDLSVMPDSALGSISDIIYADKVKASLLLMTKADSLDSKSVEVVTHNNGHTITTYNGGTAHELIGYNSLPTQFIDKFNTTRG